MNPPNPALKRLKKKPAAILGLLIIILVSVVAVLGYFIAPDNSPNADLQTVEIQAKPPGYKQAFLKIPAAGATTTGCFQQLLYGKKQSWNYIPISGYRIHKDSLYIDKYVDEDTSVVQAFPATGPAGLNEKNITQKTYRLGTDKFGRDILSRLIIGTRVSLAVGLIAVLISLTLGIFLGALAGYYRGWVDDIIMWLVNVTWSIPTLLLVFAITMAMGKGFWQIFLAIGLTMWVSVARLIRGQVMAIRELEYIQAAKAMGMKSRGIIGYR